MVKPRNRNRVNAKGRNKTTRFTRLDLRILSSNAYRALSPNDRSLLVELAMLYNGKNNGSLYLSVRDAAHRMGVADLSAASRSFQSLQELGFIELTMDSDFRSGSSGQSRARCWRITWEAGPGRKPPTARYLDLEPAPKTNARKRMERGLRALKSYRYGRDKGNYPVLDSDTLGQFSPKSPTRSVLDSNTLNEQNGGKPPIECVRESDTHIAIPWGRESERNLVGWWHTDWPATIKAHVIANLSTRNSTSLGLEPAGGLV